MRVGRSLMAQTPTPTCRTQPSWAETSRPKTSLPLGPLRAHCVSGFYPCLPVDPLTGLAFPGNVIPAGRFSKLAQVTEAGGLFPAPNSTSPLGNFLLREGLPNTTHQQTYRGDQELWGNSARRSFAGHRPTTTLRVSAIHHFRPAITYSRKIR